MQKIPLSTYKPAILSVLLIILGCTNASGQVLLIPDRWKSEWYEPQPLFNPDTLNICILGDVMMHGKQIENTHREGDVHDFSSFFRFIEEDIRNADLSVANMEFTLGGKPYTGYPSFSAPDGFETYLAECGFDIFLAANNHIFDKAAYGASRTLEKYRNLHLTHGVSFTGLAGSEEELGRTTPLLLRRKGLKLAFINFTYGTNQSSGKLWPQTNCLSETQKLDSAFAKCDQSGADYIIALPHWGVEYQFRHSKIQESTAQRLAGSGADVVIGSHPHVIQDCQDIDGVQIAYSLGNAVSNMSAANTQLGLMAIIRIARDQYGHTRILPLTFRYLWCSLPGGYDSSYTVIPVAEFLGRKDEWQGTWDYEKMVRTYEHVKRITGIPDCGNEMEFNNE